VSQNWKSLIERRPDVAPKAKEQESGSSWSDWMCLKIGDLTKHHIFTEKALFCGEIGPFSVFNTD
jgi:hypothetical protein